MARNIAIQIEAIIAISLFLVFLAFYFRIISINYGIFQNSPYEKESYLDSLINSLENNYYIVSFNITIPEYAKIICNDQDLSNICQYFPVYISSNISFLTNYSGVLNGTYNTYFNSNFGAFFYLNLSNFNNCIDSNYTLVEIYNPNNFSLYEYQIFITNPTIYYWLSNGYNLSVEDQGGNSIPFCYFHSDFYCNTTSNGAYGIWVKVNLSANGFYILNISLSNQNYALDGSNIFDFYDHFNYTNCDQLKNNWQIYSQNIFYTCGYNNIFYINITVIPPNQNVYFVSYLNLTSNNLLSNESYLIFYRMFYIITSNQVRFPSFSSFNLTIGNYSFLIYPIDTYQYLFIRNISLSQFYPINITFYGNFSSMSYNNYTLYLDYIVIRKFVYPEPIYWTIYQPYCYNTYNFILGPDIEYNLSNYDITIINNLNSIGIENNYIAYFENNKSLDIVNTYINSNMNILSIYQNAIYNFSFYQNEPYPITNLYNFNISAFFYYSDNNVSLKKIIFSNSSIFMVSIIYKNQINNITIPIWGQNSNIFSGDSIFYYYFSPFYLSSNNYVFNSFVPISYRKILTNYSNYYLLILTNLPAENILYLNSSYNLYNSTIFFNLNNPNILNIYYLITNISNPEELQDLYYLLSLFGYNINIRKVEAISLDQLENYTMGFVILNIPFSYGNISNTTYSKEYTLWILDNNTLNKYDVVIYI